MPVINRSPDNATLGSVILLGIIGVVAAQAAIASDKDTENYIQDKCAGCHALSADDFDVNDMSERMHRKGPPLYYAGDKFKKEWLQGWLESPSRIRPGGSFPPDHTVVTDDGDVIDEKTLLEHPSVAKPKAGEVAEFLLTLHLKARPPLKTAYQPKEVSPMLGKMNFNKFKGCSACHRDKEEVGGVSGPELYSAWNRLQPEFMVSYIKNPVAWDAHSMMPNKHLQEPEIHKLVDYLKLIGEKRP